MATTIKFVGVALVGLGLVACAPTAFNYGEATAYNKVAQVIDPNPAHGPDDAQPGDNGERGATAAEAYRKGEVKQPRRTSGRNGQGNGGGLGGLGAAGGPR